MWRTIKRIIQDNSRFLLTTHVNPDGDGIGAACALTELLISQGKQVRFVCDSPIPSKFAFLDFHGTHEEFSPREDYSDTQVLVVLDTHRLSRIGRVAAVADLPGVIPVCIDHHGGGDPFTDNVALDTNACSVGAMVYTLYKESGYDLNICAATGVYASVICDTGRFSYSSTSRKAHKIADECIRLGVDPDEMHSRLFQHVTLAQIKMFARALNRMETHLEGRVVVQQILRNDYVTCGEVPEATWDSLEHLDLEYIHEFNKLIEDVECVVLLREVSDSEVRLSLRSRSELDVGQVVKPLGGGGHCKAAGATVSGRVSEVKGLILDELKALLAGVGARDGSSGL